MFGRLYLQKIKPLILEVFAPLLCVLHQQAHARQDSTDEVFASIK